MIDPAGTTSRGVSDGMGTITFSEGVDALDFFIRTSNSASSGQVQIIDDTGAVIEDITSTINSINWLHISKQLNNGDPLIASVVVKAFGSHMLVLDNLSFSTFATSTNTTTDIPDDTSDDTSAESQPDTISNEEEVSDETTDIYGSNTGSDSSSGGGIQYLLLTFFYYYLKNLKHLNYHSFYYLVLFRMYLST